TAALIGAIFLGPRIGKYVTGKDGKKEARAIPGHSITIGALGVFILWFGWYGFNGAAATDIATLGKIFVTTTLAPAFASCATMAFTWIKNGKPDVSMTLNGSLAGLVAITAGCANVDALGSIIIGLVAGIWVVVVVEVLDLKLHIDDPVGAVGVHFANGIWGTLAVGLFSTDTGLFYGGGFRQLGVQALGIVAILAYTTVMMLITFTLIKKFHGLRVSPEEEISGLDSVEHGLASAYAGFEFALDPTLAEYSAAPAEMPVPVDVAVPVTAVSAPKAAPSDGKKITKVEIICKESRFEALKAAMDAVGITGMTVTKVLGCGIQKGKTGYYRGVKIESMDLNPKVQVDIVVSAVPVRTLVEAAKKALYTGNIGDGKIFVYDVENVIKVRTGEEGFDALQGDEQF
ncbi:MAG: ammonium transporter, partial [Candidatus Fimenecus sp.]